MVTWRDEKRKRNIAKHGVDLSLSDSFDFDTALVVIDDSEDYGEERLVAVGFIRLAMYTLVYVEGELGEPHAISLRRSTKQEIRVYVQANEKP